ncbi:hypothetical protein [uncultured Fibrella sp.]|uniref:hypothetical protein n=1 Tax=uncultured Fibrella sp. TaxID=1284596 RepID=UPI0035CA44B3
MKKLPRFLITQNEAAKVSSPFIVHTQRPAFVARALSFPDEAAIEAYLNEHQPTYVTLVRDLPMLIEVVQIFQNPADITPGLLSRLGDWYYYTQIKPGDEPTTLQPIEPSRPS